MAEITYAWQGFVDTGMQDDNGPIRVDVYTCSGEGCWGLVAAPVRGLHESWHNPVEPEPDPEPEPEEPQE